MDPIVSLIKAHNPDAILMQEMHDLTFEQLKKRIRTEYPFSYGFFPKRPAQGQVLFSKRPITVINKQMHHVSFTHEGHDINLIGVHFPSPRSGSSIQKAEYELISTARYIRGAVEDKPFIVAGDMNSAYWHPRLLDFITRIGIGPVTIPVLSWPSYIPVLLQIPIDYIFTSQHLCILSSERGEASGSDHFPVIATFVLCNANK